MTIYPDSFLTLLGELDRNLTVWPSPSWLVILGLWWVPGSALCLHRADHGLLCGGGKVQAGASGGWCGAVCW